MRCASPVPIYFWHDRGFHHHLPCVRPSGDRAHADGRLPVFLCLQRVRRTAQAEARRLLRILFVRLGTLSAHSTKQIVLFIRPVIPMTTEKFGTAPVRHSRFPSPY